MFLFIKVGMNKNKNYMFRWLDEMSKPGVIPYWLHIDNLENFVEYMGYDVDTRIIRALCEQEGLITVFALTENETLSSTNLLQSAKGMGLIEDMVIDMGIKELNRLFDLVKDSIRHD